MLVTLGPTEAACTTHQCDSSTYDYFGGRMTDPFTYESNDINRPWLDYGGMTTVRLWFPPASLGLTPIDAVVYTGLDETPNGGDSFVDGDLWSQAAGQNAVFNSFNTEPMTGPDGGPTVIEIGDASFGGSIQVTNASCARYFARIVVHFGPRESAATGMTGPDAPLVDAGAEASGQAIDAEASPDAGAADAGGD